MLQRVRLCVLTDVPILLLEGFYRRSGTGFATGSILPYGRGSIDVPTLPYGRGFIDVPTDVPTGVLIGGIGVGIGYVPIGVPRRS